MTKIRLTAITIIISFAVSLTAFAQNAPSDWAASDIYAAIESGFVPTDLQSDYTADITRLGFARTAIMFLAFVRGITPEQLAAEHQGSPFTDTDDRFADAAYNLKIINGRDAQSFAPNDSITRQEAAKILVRTYTAYTGTAPQLSDDGLTYADSAEISDWADEYVRTVTELHIMNGDDNGNFMPLSPYTVEQSIVTFERMCRLIENEETRRPIMDGSNPKIEQMLKSENGYLTDGEKTIILNGVNLGNWLLIEQWMSPVEEITADTAYSDILDVLENRFGARKAAELIQIYENNFITEEDFDVIEKLGFNCVRVPFWYRNFMDADLNYLTDSADKNPGFRRLDALLDVCSRHGIYVVLDMHGCPGGQSMNHSTGVSGKNELYTDEKNLSAMEDLWLEISKRYKDNPCIAAYDIMNEPQNNGGYSGNNAWAAESTQAVSHTNAVYDRMIKAIRRTGDNHIITLEGIWSINTLPDPVKSGWDNVMYQLHIYDGTESGVDNRISELCNIAVNKYKTAVLVGEYNSKACERYAAGRYAEEGISRIKWTYKTINADYDGWGIYNKNIPRINIQTASEQEIRKAFGSDMVTGNGFELNVREYNKIMNR